MTPLLFWLVLAPLALLIYAAVAQFVARAVDTGPEAPPDWVKAAVYLWPLGLFVLLGVALGDFLAYRAFGDAYGEDE